MGQCPFQRGGDRDLVSRAHGLPAPSNRGGIQHLISTLATGLQMGTPRINTFSGNATPGNTEVSFEQWYHEVQCADDHCLESVVQKSIERDSSRYGLVHGSYH